MAKQKISDTGMSEIAKLAQSMSRTGGVQREAYTAPVANVKANNYVYGIPKSAFNGQYTTSQILDSIAQQDKGKAYTSKSTTDQILAIQKTPEFKKLLKQEKQQQKNANAFGGTKGRIAGAFNTATMGIAKHIPLSFLPGKQGNLTAGDYLKQRLGNNYEKSSAYKQGEYIGYLTPTGLEGVGEKALIKAGKYVPKLGKAAKYLAKETPKFVKPATTVGKVGVKQAIKDQGIKLTSKELIDLAKQAGKYGVKQVPQAAAKGAVEGVTQGALYSTGQGVSGVATGEMTPSQAIQNIAVNTTLGAGAGGVLGAAGKLFGSSIKAMRTKYTPPEILALPPGYELPRLKAYKEKLAKAAAGQQGEGVIITPTQQKALPEAPTQEPQGIVGYDVNGNPIFGIASSQAPDYVTPSGRQVFTRKPQPSYGVIEQPPATPGPVGYDANGKPIYGLPERTSASNNLVPAKRNLRLNRPERKPQVEQQFEAQSAVKKLKRNINIKNPYSKLTKEEQKSVAEKTLAKKADLSGSFNKEKVGNSTHYFSKDGKYKIVKNASGKWEVRTKSLNSYDKIESTHKSLNDAQQAVVADIALGGELHGRNDAKFIRQNVLGQKPKFAGKVIGKRKPTQETLQSTESSSGATNARDEYVTQQMLSSSREKGTMFTFKELKKEIEVYKKSLKNFVEEPGKMSKEKTEKYVEKLERIYRNALDIPKSATTETYDVQTHGYDRKGVTEFTLKPNEFYIKMYDQNSGKIKFEKVNGKKVDLGNGIDAFYHYDEKSKTHRITATAVGNMISSVQDSVLKGLRGNARKAEGQRLAIEEAKRKIDNLGTRKIQAELSKKQDYSPAVENFNFKEFKPSEQVKPTAVKPTAVKPETTKVNNGPSHSEFPDISNMEFKKNGETALYGQRFDEHYVKIDSGKGDGSFKFERVEGERVNNLRSVNAFYYYDEATKSYVVTLSETGEKLLSIPKSSVPKSKPINGYNRELNDFIAKETSKKVKSIGYHKIEDYISNLDPKNLVPHKGFYFYDRFNELKSYQKGNTGFSGRLVPEAYRNFDVLTDAEKLQYLKFLKDDKKNYQKNVKANKYNVNIKELDSTIAMYENYFNRKSSNGATKALRQKGIVNRKMISKNQPDIGNPNDNQRRDITHIGEVGKRGAIKKKFENRLKKKAEKRRADKIERLNNLNQENRTARMTTSIQPATRIVRTNLPKSPRNPSARLLAKNEPQIVRNPNLKKEKLTSQNIVEQLSNGFYKANDREVTMFLENTQKSASQLAKMLKNETDPTNRLALQEALNATKKTIQEVNSFVATGRPLNISAGKEPSMVRVKPEKPEPSVKEPNTSEAAPPTPEPQQLTRSQREALAQATEKKIVSMKKRVRQTNLNAFGKVRTALQNKNYSFKQLVDDMNPANESHMDSLYKMANQASSAGVIAQHMLLNEATDYFGNAVGKSLKEILKGSDKKKIAALNNYMINEHAITRYNRGEMTFDEILPGVKWTPEVGNMILRDIKKIYPDIDKLAADYRQFNDFITQYEIQGGTLDKAAFEAFKKKNPTYVSNQRQLNPTERPENYRTGKTGYSNQKNSVKEAGKGSSKDIIDPVESLIQRTFQAVSAVHRNRVIQTLYKALKNAPDDLSHVGEIIDISGKERQDILDSINKRLETEGPDGLTSHLTEEFNKIFENLDTAKDKSRIVTGFVDGQPVHIKVKDVSVLEALKTLNEDTNGMVLKFLSVPSNLFKAVTTTFNPLFSIGTALPRDVFGGFIASKTTKNPVKYMADLMTAYYDIIKNTESFKQYKRSGGGMSGLVGSNINLIQETKNVLSHENRVKSIFNSVVQGLEKTSTIIEEAPRLAEFKRYADSIENFSNNLEAKLKAAYEANDITVNFSQRGRYGNGVEALFPYFKAMLNGLEKSLRTYAENKTTNALGKSIAALTIPTMALYFMNHNNPKYQMLDQKTKDNNFIFPLPNGDFVKIAAPPEFSFVFKILPERMLRALYDNDPTAFDGMSEAFIHAFIPPGASGVAEALTKKDVLQIFNDTMVGPLANVAANKNSFGGPIEPMYLRQLSPGQRYDANTTPIAKWIGKTINVSPKYLDYVFNSYTGGISQAGTPIVMGKNPLDSLKRRYVVDPYISNNIMDQFYKYKDELNQGYNDVRLGRVKPSDVIFIKKFINKQYDRISDLQGLKRKTMEDKTLTKKQRQETLDKLQIVIVEIAKETVQKINSVK